MRSSSSCVVESCANTARAACDLSAKLFCMHGSSVLSVAEKQSSVRVGVPDNYRSRNICSRSCNFFLREYSRASGGRTNCSPPRAS